MSHDLGIGISVLLEFVAIGYWCDDARIPRQRIRRRWKKGWWDGRQIRRRSKSLCLLAVCQYNATAERDTRIYGISLSKTQNSCPLPPLMEWTINLNVQTDNVPYVKRLRHCSGQLPQMAKIARRWHGVGIGSWMELKLVHSASKLRVRRFVSPKPVAALQF